MLTSKQRAALRGAASVQEPIFQIGKEGVGENLTAACDSALTARELIKITVLKRAPLTPREAGELLAEKLRAEFVAAIGSKCILYRYSKNKTDHVSLG